VAQAQGVADLVRHQLGDERPDEPLGNPVQQILGILLLGFFLLLPVLLVAPGFGGLGPMSGIRSKANRMAPDRGPCTPQPGKAR
jgi:hypothetical protein